MVVFGDVFPSPFVKKACFGDGLFGCRKKGLFWGWFSVFGEISKILRRYLCKPLPISIVNMSKGFDTHTPQTVLLKMSKHGSTQALIPRIILVESKQESIKK